MKAQYKVLAEKYSLITENNIGNVYYMTKVFGLGSVGEDEYEFINANLVTPEDIHIKFYEDHETYYRHYTEEYFLPFEELIKKLNEGEVMAIEGDLEVYTLCKDMKDLLSYNYLERIHLVDRGEVKREDADRVNMKETDALYKLHRQLKDREELYKDNPGINIDI